MEKIVVDTDVIIDFLRGYDASVNFINDNNIHPVLSAVTITELYAGIKSDEEEIQIEHFLDAVEVIAVTRSIAEVGGRIRNQYGRSHGTGVIDSIIAGTVIFLEMPFATLNQKHYPMIDELVLPYEKRL